PGSSRAPACTAGAMPSASCGWPGGVKRPPTGVQAATPNGNGVTSGNPLLLLLRMYQVPDGSTAPTVATPSPFQSPTTGFQPGAPNWKEMERRLPEASTSLRNQVMVAGSTTPTP